MISVFLFAIMGFIGFYIIVLFLVVIFNYGVRFFAIKSYRRNNKDIIQRHKTLNYDKFEVEVIKKVCSEKLFPFYFIYTCNYNIWKNLKDNLAPDEKVLDISSTFLKVGKGIFKNFYQSLFFSTNKGRFFLYQDTTLYRNKAKARLLLLFELSDIKDLGYEIEPKHIKILKYCVPAKLYINLKNGKDINFLLGCAITIERIKDRIIQLLPEEEITISREGMDLDVTERQIKKIEDAFKAGKLKEPEYKELVERAQKSGPDIMRDYYTEFERFEEPSVKKE